MVEKRFKVKSITSLVLVWFLLAACGVLPRFAPPPSATLPSTPTTAPPPTVPPQPQVVVALEEQVVSVYQSVGPAVVNITSLGYVFDFFMGSVPQEGSGSGFVYDTEGNIITNFHVVEGAEELFVTLESGEEYPAALVGTDSSNDLAVIHIEAGEALPPPLPLSDSDELRVGQFVVAIGAPFGLEQTLTTGVVSALGRVIESPEANQFIGEAIQTDAAINPGNSGGPLLDLQGRVIGVNSQILSTSGSSAGVGFAISANTVRRVAPALIEQGFYPHPWLGIQTLDINERTVDILREAGMEVGVEQGVLVIDFQSGSPAAEAGLRGGSRVVRIGRYRLPVGGDIITAVDGVTITSMEELTVYLELNTRVGETVEIAFERRGEGMTLPVVLKTRPNR